VDTPGRAHERDAKDLLERADAFTVGRREVVTAAHVEHLAPLQAEELLALRLVREEADVLFDRKLLLADEGDRLPRARPVGSQRRDAIEVRDRPDELVDEEAVVFESFVGHARTE
jgi:hypothetical protein